MQGGRRARWGVSAQWRCSVLALSLLPIALSFMIPIGNAPLAKLGFRQSICAQPARFRRVGMKPKCAASASADPNNQVQLAISKCKEAVQGNPQNEEAWFFLGVMLQETGAYGEAMQAFQNSVKLNPKREAAWLNIGLLHEASGNKPLALQSFMGAINSNAKSANAYIRLGMLMDSVGKEAAAVSAYEKALGIDVHNPATHNLLVKLLIKYNKLDSARIAGQRAVDACPDSSQAHTALGSAFIELNRAREGVRSLQKAVELDEENAEAHNALGVAHRAMARMGEAERSYKEAIRLQPSLPEPHYNLALLYRDQGPLYASKAIQALRSTIALNPSNYAAQLLLAALSSKEGEGDSSWLEAAGGLPLQHVTGMFDAVATTYDEEVLPALQYCAPRLALQALRTVVLGGESSSAVQKEPVASEQPQRGGSAGGREGEKFPGGEEGMGRGGGVVAGLFEKDGLLGGAGEFKGLDEWRELGREILEAQGQDWRVVDVGCGTGCCGWALQGAGQGLVGCDLSQGMVARAEASGVYERAVQMEGAAFLAQEPPGSADLVVAVDVMPYVWDMSHMLRAAAQALRGGGLLLLTTEEPTRELAETEGGEGGEVQLNQFARVCHGEGGVRRLAAAVGLEVRAVQLGRIRMQGSRQVLGKAFVLQKPKAAAD